MMTHLERLEQTGVKMNYACEISPFGGKKKTMNLNRTKIDIIPENKIKESYIPALYLPSFRLPKFHYQLTLEQLPLKQDLFCYSLKTVEGHPYLLNGQLVRESLIEKNDVVYIGEHKLLFKDQNYHQSILELTEHTSLDNESMIKSSLPIYIEGETGSGKSRLARKIHDKSQLKGKFVHLNLSALSPHLVESELFGHTKGAFTGAISDKIGAFEQANEGTLFLDEIDSTTPEIQTKILLFLDNNNIRPVGSNADKKITTRIIFSSGRSLKHLVEKGLIRKDFYFRVSSSFKVNLPPLRSAPELIKKFCLQFGIEKKVSFTDRLMDFYLSLPWPGNFRQLRGHLDCKKTLSKSSKLDFDELDESLLIESSELRHLPVQTHWTTLAEMKKAYVLKALDYHHGKINITARALDVSEKTIQRLIISERGGK